MSVAPLEVNVPNQNLVKSAYSLFVDKAYGTPKRTQRTLVLCFVMLMVGAAINVQLSDCKVVSTSALVR